MDKLGWFAFGLLTGIGGTLLYLLFTVYWFSGDKKVEDNYANPEGK